MCLQEYDDKDGRKVWLEGDEVDLLLDTVPRGERYIAMLLGVRCGLRVSEIIDVRPKDVVLTSAGPRVRVHDGKGGKYRETPAPPVLYQQADASMSLGDKDESDTLIGSDSTRTVRQWVYDLGAELAELTGDDGWRHIGPHDLRRTWATQLSGYDINPLLVCEWGGWDDLSTFLDHYHGIYSPDVQRRELQKVPWMDVDTTVTDDRDPELRLLRDQPEIPVATTPSSGGEPLG